MRHGRPYGSVGLPGTGLSVREYGKPVNTSAHPNAVGFAVGVFLALVVVLLLMLAAR